MKTSAVKQGDYYILNGTKLWITNAGEAGVYAVFANAKPTSVSTSLLFVLEIKINTIFGL